MENAMKNHDESSKATKRMRTRKSKQELDQLRRDVLVANKLLRDESAPPKAHTSTFTKVLNKFAERRQAIDNDIQGLDSAGKRTGKKKMCHRLLPLRNPEVGIFANGSKGAEIKRENLALTESDKARIESDLQKLLHHGVRRSKRLKSQAANKLQQKCQETVEKNESDSPENQSDDNVLETNPAPVVTSKKPNGKRRLQVPIEQDGNTKKVSNAEMHDTKTIAKQLKTDNKRNNSAGKKCKRSLFQDENDDSDHPIHLPCVEDLRFSPTLGKAKVKKESGEPKSKPASRKLNLNCAKVGKKVITAKYQKLCAVVSAQSFTNCLKQTPHVDPRTKIKKSLGTLYSVSRQQKMLVQKRPTKVSKANIKNSKHSRRQTPLEDQPSTSNFKIDIVHQAIKLEAPAITVKTEPTGNSHQNASTSSETSIIAEWETNSLRVNYDSVGATLKSEITESSGTTDTSCEKVQQQCTKERIVERPTSTTPSQERSKFLNEKENQLTQAPSLRKKILQRYLQETNNSGSFPSRKSEEEVTSTVKSEVKPRCFQTVTRAANSATVNCPDTRQNFDNVPGPSKNNLSSASSSTLPKFPSARKKLMMRYLREVSNQDRPNPFTETLEENQEHRCSNKETASATLGSSPSTKKILVKRYLQEVNSQEEQPAISKASESNAEKRCFGDEAQRPEFGLQMPIKVETVADSLTVNCDSDENSHFAKENLDPRLPQVPEMRKAILQRFLHDVEVQNMERQQVETAENFSVGSARHMPVILRRSQRERVWHRPSSEDEIGQDFGGITISHEEPEVMPTPAVVNALYELNEYQSRTSCDFSETNLYHTIPPYNYHVEHFQTNGFSGQDRDYERFPVFPKRSNSSSTANSDELPHIAPQNEPHQVHQLQVFGASEQVELLHRMHEQNVRSQMFQLPRSEFHNISTSLMQPPNLAPPDSGVTYHWPPPPAILNIPARSYSEERFERRLNFVVPFEQTESISHNTIINPLYRSAVLENLPYPQNFSPMLEELRNYNYQLLIDSGYAHAAFFNSQIGENAGRYYQHVTQPIYNVTDVHPPQQSQVLPDYSPSDD
ncbi:uncharacterized protein LOC124174739 isoform X1 [Neodiprion fabricii]|uniref:uncharacterized protein LOC124174739 isoform X1 n=1 Tax=Neodiprion fabricii TaxID=2872261 RepID=UPI001ED981EE|nr:uncharacterized protein LOC124174739 isoform X1 [Neodiprion fabricii]XP_046410120.1 uncharacterized protein LOC124174739 isoform X1 [Neodiprion fabricii]